MVPTRCCTNDTCEPNLPGHRTGACSSSCDIRSAYVTHRPPPLGVICRWTSWWYRLQHPQPPRCTSLQQLRAVRGLFHVTSLRPRAAHSPYFVVLSTHLNCPYGRHFCGPFPLTQVSHTQSTSAPPLASLSATASLREKRCAEGALSHGPGGRVAGPQGPLEGSRLRACWASPGAGRTAGGAALGRRARPLAGRAASLAGSVAGSAGAAGSSAASSAAGIAYRAWGGDPRGRRGRIDEG